MRKSIFIVLVLIFCAPLSILAQDDKNAELQRIDSLMKEFEENDNIQAGYEIIMINQEDTLSIPLEEIKKWDPNKIKYTVCYEYSSLLLNKYSAVSKSLQYTKKSLQYALLLPEDLRKIGYCYSMLAACYNYYGLYDRVIDCYKKNVKCSEKLKSYSDMAFDYANISCIYVKNRNYDLAEKYVKKSLEMLEIAEKRKEKNLEDGYFQSYVYSFAQYYYMETKQYDKSLEYSNKAYVLDSINHRDYEMHVRKYEKATVFIETGQKEYAFQMLEELYNYFNDNNKKNDVIYCLIYLEKYEEAISLARECNDCTSQLAALRGLIKNATNLDSVKCYTKEYIQLKDSLNSRANALAMQGFNAEYDAQQREQTILQQKTALEKQRIKWYWAWSIAAMLVIVIVISVRGWVRDNRNKKRISKALADLEVASAELEKSNSDLEETNKVKDKLIRVISHDLSGSTSNVNMLAHMVAEKMKDELSLMLVSQSDNLKSFFDDLLIWVKMQRTGSMEIHSTNLSLNQVADDVIKLIAETANGKELKLTHTIPAGTNIVADRSLVHCIIRNLVNNAVKFTPRGGSVTISFEQNTISVIDTGKGMTPDVVEMLLTGSQWVHTDGTEGEVGTGLGLSIVRDMVAMMKARLTIESEVGKGSVFSIHL